MGGTSRHLIEQYRHFFSTYFCFKIFKSLYGYYNIQEELANKPSVINLFPTTFGIFYALVGGGGVYWKSDKSFANLLQIYEF